MVLNYELQVIASQSRQGIWLFRRLHSHWKRVQRWKLSERFALKVKTYPSTLLIDSDVSGYNRQAQCRCVARWTTIRSKFPDDVHAYINFI